jgi:hypothetical protein
MTKKKTLKQIEKDISSTRSEFQIGQGMFQECPPPTTDDDWLAKYEEGYQCLAKFKTEAPHMYSRGSNL